MIMQSQSFGSGEVAEWLTQIQSACPFLIRRSPRKCRMVMNSNCFVEEDRRSNCRLSRYPIGWGLAVGLVGGCVVGGLRTGGGGGVRATAVCSYVIIWDRGIRYKSWGRPKVATRLLSSQAPSQSLSHAPDLCW